MISSSWPTASWRLLSPLRELCRGIVFRPFFMGPESSSQCANSPRNRIGRPYTSLFIRQIAPSSTRVEGYAFPPTPLPAIFAVRQRSPSGGFFDCKHQSREAILSSRCKLRRARLSRRERRRPRVRGERFRTRRGG